jgi:redox-sensitive bicupin YhaK (pirin superfamily)
MTMALTQADFEIRRGRERGTTDLGWLHSRHSFSFGAYHDPARIAFRSLRVLNDDVVEPGGGFGEHGHDNMEIISWVLDGGLAHADSTGTRGVIEPGDVQVMTAGAGIRHSEMNASGTAPVHFLQIWIVPAVRDAEPSYVQRRFPKDGRRDRWQRLVRPDGRDGSIRIAQDAHLSVAEVGAGARIEAGVGDGRHGYLHVARGTVRIGDETLGAGDAVTWTGAGRLEIVADEASALMLFDLA